MSNENKIFVNRPILISLRKVFKIFDKLLPETLVSRIALKIFLFPSRKKTFSWEQNLKKSAKKRIEKAHGNQFVTYEWGDGKKKVLLCHAWGGRGTMLGRLVPVFVKHGYTVVAFDAPGHGESPKYFSDMVEYLYSINRLVEVYEHFDIAVGHSFGAGNLLWATHVYNFKPNTLVLIGCFQHGRWVIEAFGDALGLRGEVILGMQRQLEKKHNVLKWNSLSMVDFVSNLHGKLILMHDELDKTIPFSHAKNLIDHAKKNSNLDSELIRTKNSGHIKIVLNKKIMERLAYRLIE